MSRVRRDLLIAASAFFVASLAVRAQAPEKVWRIGWVNVAGSQIPEVVRQVLRERGWVEGKNIELKYRYAPSPAGIQRATEELVASGVDIILTVSAGNAEQILKVTKTIPVVVLAAGDLQSTGLIATLRRPGGNLTGTQIYSPELMTKRLQLLKEVLPVSRLAILRPTSLPEGLVKAYVQMTDSAGERFGIRTRYVTFESAEMLEGLFAGMIEQREQALLVWSHPFTIAHRHKIVALATQNRLPVMGEHRVWAESGALLTYGPRLEDVYAEAASLVDKILRGAKPGDLPIGQPTTFELVVNLQSAKTLGITIAPAFKLRADRVIE